MDDRTIAGARTPDRSPLLERRVAAGLVDLAAIAVMTGSVAAATSTRVPAIRQADGSVAFTAADRAQLETMNGPLSRGHLLGDTLWAFSTLDVIAVAASTVVAGIIIGVLLPRFLGGRSPGKFLFRMRVVTVDGRAPGIVRHAIRTLVSVADLMPVIVPGLTGYAFAASNPRRQRIGDRLARTVVVNGHRMNDTTAVAAAIESTTDVTGAHRTRPVPTIKSATLHHRRAATGTDTYLNRRPESPDQRDDEAARPSRAGETVDMNDTDSAIEESEPSSSAAGPIPVEERSNNPYPKPVRRRRETDQEPSLSDQEPSIPGFDSLTLPESSLSDMPLTNTALFEALGITDPGDTAAMRGDLAQPRSPSPTPDSTAAAAAEDGPDPEPTGQPTKLAVREPSSPAPDKRAPIWSEDWDAWIYWDTTLEHWFRHDMASDNWVPLEED